MKIYQSFLLSRLKCTNQNLLNFYDVLKTSNKTIFNPEHLEKRCQTRNKIAGELKELSPDKNLIISIACFTVEKATKTDAEIQIFLKKDWKRLCYKFELKNLHLYYKSIIQKNNTTDLNNILLNQKNSIENYLMRKDNYTI